MQDRLVIGYGNPLRGDDGAGWDAAYALRRSDDTLRVLTVQQLTPELAEDVSQARIVVFLDANAEALPGEVRVQEVLAQRDCDWAGFTHHCDPSLLLALSSRVFGRCPGSAWIITVGAEQFDCEECLSEAVRAALPEMVGEALQHLAAETPALA